MTRVPVKSNLDYRQCRSAGARHKDPRSDCRQHAEFEFVAQKPEKRFGVNQEAVARIAQLQMQLSKCESDRDQLRANASQIGIEIFREIVALTTQLFGERVFVYESRDPEFPEDITTVFEVETPLESQQILQSEREWNSTIQKLAPKDSASLALLIYPQR